MNGENTEWTCNHLRSQGYYDCRGNDPRTYTCALTGKHCVGTEKKGRQFTGKHYDNSIAEETCSTYNLPVELAKIIREATIDRAKSKLEEGIMARSGKLT